MRTIAIIPARYASTRFPGKPLACLYGKPVIQHVYERAIQALGDGNVFVATDSEQILNAVAKFGGTAIITSESCANGTERVREAYGKCGIQADAVINIQGDEPMIDPRQITTLAQLLTRPNTQIATLVRRILADEDATDPALVKAVTALDGTALYFSRAAIPFYRDGGDGARLAHVGMYGFKTDVLLALASLTPTPLEQAEKLEQLRWLQHGYRIVTAMTDIRTVGIDTPQDLEQAEKLMAV